MKCPRCGGVPHLTPAKIRKRIYTCLPCQSAAQKKWRDGHKDKINEARRVKGKKSLKVPIEKKFWPFVEKTLTCWVWKGRLNKKGYGVIASGRPSTMAHRISLMIHGQDVSDVSLAADHICRNRRCVNPEHLRLVSFRINALENSIGFAAVNSKKTHCPYGHEYRPARIRKDGSRERRCLECQKIRGKRWQSKPEVQERRRIQQRLRDQSIRALTPQAGAKEIK